MKLPENVELAIEEFVKACKRKFKKDLVSIVLFGSYARGDWKKYSDVDLLIIAKKLPKDLKERFDLLDETVMLIAKKFRIKIMPIFFEPDELSTTYPNPLVYGILTGFKVILGEEFWNSYLKSLYPFAAKVNPEYWDGERKWMIKNLIEDWLRNS